MAASLGELFIELGVFADTKELKEFENKLQQISKTMDKTGKKTEKSSVNFKKLLRGLRNAAVAVIGAIYALSKLTDSLVANNQEFLNLTRNSDIALGTFQKWNNVGRMFGVKNAAQQLANLNQRLFELKLTGEGADGFILAGINPLGQDAEGVMEQLRNRVSGLDDTAATFLLYRMGLDPSMLHLLRMTREEFEELGKVIKKYQLTKEQTQQIQAFNTQLQVAQIKLKYIKDRAILAIMPYFVKFVESLARVTEFLGRLIRMTKEYIASMNGLQKGILVVAGALGILRAALMAVTAHPIVAAITAILGVLYLLMDDIMAYFQGGRSGIGYLLYFFDELNAKLNSISTPQWVRDLLNLFQGLGRFSFIINPFTWAMPDYDKINSMFLPSGNGNNTTNNYNNKQITMNNAITTSQTGPVVLDELAYLQNTAYSFL